MTIESSHASFHVHFSYRRLEVLAAFTNAVRIFALILVMVERSEKLLMSLADFCPSYGCVDITRAKAVHWSEQANMTKIFKYITCFTPRAYHESS